MQIDLDRASEGKNEEKLTTESDKDEINSQLNGESQQNGEPDTSNKRNRLIILDTFRHSWPPALCRDGGDFGESH